MTTEDIQLRYHDFLTDIGIRKYRIAALFAIVLVPGGVFFDFFIYPDYIKKFLYIRLISSFIYLIFFLPISYIKPLQKHHRPLGIFLTLAVAAPIVLMTRFVGGYESSYYAGLNLIILAVSVVFPWNAKETMVSCLGIYLSYIIPVLLFDQVKNWGVFTNNNYFLSFTCIISITKKD